MQFGGGNQDTGKHIYIVIITMPKIISIPIDDAGREMKIIRVLRW